MKEEDFNYLYQLEEHLWWFVGMREITANLLGEELLRLTADTKILDAGCGTGGMLDFLTHSSASNNVFGIDVSTDALRFCHQRGHKKLSQASATAKPFSDNSFDLVTSFDVLVQIPGEGEDITALKEAYRVLKPNGILFVRAAAYSWMRSGHDQALATQRRYTSSELENKLAISGFQVIRTTYVNSVLLPVAMVRRLLLKPMGLADRGSDVKPLPRKLEFINRLFTGVLSAESYALKHFCQRIPFGLSVICIAKKV